MSQEAHDWFFSFHEDDQRKALALCAECPVQAPCLETQLPFAASSDFGIWGGTTPEERREIRENRAAG